VSQLSTAQSHFSGKLDGLYLDLFQHSSSGLGLGHNPAQVRAPRVELFLVFLLAAGTNS